MSTIHAQPGLAALPEAALRFEGQDYYRAQQVRDYTVADRGLSRAVPIDMVLHCPNCGLQHIDQPEPPTQYAGMDGTLNEWSNPPHRSHLCMGCGFVWRPADVPTNGVQAVKTAGRADSPLRSANNLPATVSRDLFCIWYEKRFGKHPQIVVAAEGWHFVDGHVEDTWLSWQASRTHRDSDL